jgi:mannose-6-phosphate isomerase-like protein (cupin superfamily)
MIRRLHMRHPYLIRLDEPQDWLESRLDVDPRTGEVIEEQHDILWPDGPDQLYEVNDSYFYKSTKFHSHKWGWETFFIHKGEMDLYARGKVATLGEGDVILMQPYTSHQMTMLSERVVWNGLFQGVDLLKVTKNWSMILQTNPTMLEDPEVNANYLANNNNKLCENPCYAERVSKYDLHEIRPYDKPLAVFDFPGISMRQYTGRWENNGKAELWLAEIQKGFEALYTKVCPNIDLFYVIEGEVEFEVAGDVFTAGPRCMVKIPEYAPRRFRTLSDVKMYDAGGSTHWLDLFVDMRSLKMLAPEKYADKEYVKGVYKRHEYYIESVKLLGETCLL